jgi:hypothetical protein
LEKTILKEIWLKNWLPEKNATTKPCDPGGYENPKKMEISNDDENEPMI